MMMPSKILTQSIGAVVLADRANRVQASCKTLGQKAVADRYLMLALRRIYKSDASLSVIDEILKEYGIHKFLHPGTVIFV